MKYSVVDAAEPGATWRFAIHSQHPEHQETSVNHHHQDHQETQKQLTVPYDVACWAPRNYVS